MASNPWGGQVKKDPFTSASYVPDDDSFEGNSYHDPNRGRPGYVQAEDGSWVPSNYWSGGRSSRARGRIPYPDDDSFYGNSFNDPNRGRPGYVQAEDGSWVPANYWDKAKGKKSRNAVTGAPIEW